MDSQTMLGKAVVYVAIMCCVTKGIISKQYLHIKLHFIEGSVSHLGAALEILYPKVFSFVLKFWFGTKLVLFYL